MRFIFYELILLNLYFVVDLPVCGTNGWLLNDGWDPENDCDGCCAAIFEPGDNGLNGLG